MQQNKGIVNMVMKQVSEDVEVVDEELTRLQERAKDSLARIEQALAQAEKLEDWMTQQMETLRIWVQVQARRTNRRYHLLGNVSGQPHSTRQ